MRWETMGYVLLLQFYILLWGCSIISNQTISKSWSGLPVEALVYIVIGVTIPMKKVLKADEMEMRFYIDSGNFTYCSGGRYVCSCLSEKLTCNNIFYIKNSTIQKYEPAGSGYQKEAQLPEGECRKQRQGK
jgi:hypothetical protein